MSEICIACPRPADEIIYAAIIADGTTSAPWVALDMLSQTEHDPNSRAYLFCTNSDFARRVQTEIYVRIEMLKVPSFVEQSLEQELSPGLQEQSQICVDLCLFDQHICSAIIPVRDLLFLFVIFYMTYSRTGIY